MGQDENERHFALWQRRHPQTGSHASVLDHRGKMASTITDGKVIGATSSARGNDGIATGGAASLAGKSYTWSTKSTGTLQFVLEVEME